MRKIASVFWLVFMASFPALSQTSETPPVGSHNAYAEVYLRGHDFSGAGFVSFNYERSVIKKRWANYRVGLFPLGGAAVAFPVSVSWVSGPENKHHFEWGVGTVFRLEYYPNTLVSRKWFFDMPALMVPLLYRYQKEDSRFFFRGGINLWVSWPVMPSPSFSLGYRF